MEQTEEGRAVVAQADYDQRPGWVAGRLPILLLALAAAAFAPGIAADYFFSDSEIYILQNEALRAVPFSEIWKVWQTPLFETELLPLRDLVYRIEMEAFGLQPIPYKVVNLLLLVLCGWGAWIFAGEFHRKFPSNGKAKSTAGIATVVMVLWIVHPSHVESVAWAAGLKDLLSGIFGLFALCAFLRALPAPEGAPRPGLRPLLAATSFFAAALMSKVTVVPVAGMAMLLAIAAFSRSQPPRQALAKGVLTALPLLILSIAAVVLYSTLAAAGYVPHTGPETVGEKIERALRILGTMLQMGLVPYDLRLNWDVYDGGALGAIRLAVAVIGTLGAVWGAWAFAFRRIPEGFGLATAVGAAVPFLQLVPFDTWSLASERYLFWPVLGLALTAGSLVARTTNRGRRLRAATALAVGAATVVCLGLTLHRSLEWYAGPKQLLIAENESDPSQGFGAFMRIREEVPAERWALATDIAMRVEDTAERNMLLSLIRAGQAVAQAQREQGSRPAIINASRRMLEAEAAVRKVDNEASNPADKWLLYKMHLSLTPFYETLIALAPEQPAFQYNLALIEKNFMQGNAQSDAEKRFLRALGTGRLPPAVAANAWDQIAIIRLFGKDIAGARNALKFAINADPTSYRAAYRLFALETREGNVKAASIVAMQFRERALAAGMAPGTIAKKIENVNAIEHITNTVLIE